MKTVTVDMPVPVSCIPADSPAAPTYADTPDALKAQADFAARYGLMTAEYAKHLARETYLEALRANCISAAPHQ